MLFRSLDVRTGRPVRGFGDGGRVDFNLGLDRDPTRILELDRPRVVAWNGGGYD